MGVLEAILHKAGRKGIIQGKLSQDEIDQLCGFDFRMLPGQKKMAAAAKKGPKHKKQMAAVNNDDDVSSTSGDSVVSHEEAAAAPPNDNIKVPPASMARLSFFDVIFHIYTCVCMYACIDVYMYILYIM
jgi:hypothetical protein